MLTNCFTSNDIDSTVIACFEKSCNNVRTSIIKICVYKQQTTLKYTELVSVKLILHEEKMLLNLYFSAFALFFQLKWSITKFKSEKWRCKLQKVNSKLL